MRDLDLPVLLVHGYLCPKSAMLPLQRKLQSRGFWAHLVDLSPLCIQDIRVLSSELAENMERVLSEADARQCDLVGISQGGLIAMHYAQSMAAAGRVRHLVALGTPFKGTWASALGLPLLGLVSKGIRQTVPGSRFLEELMAAGIPSGVRVTTISISGDLLAPPDRCALAGAENIRLRGFPSPVTHQALIFSANALEALYRALSAK